MQGRAIRANRGRNEQLTAVVRVTLLVPRPRGSGELDGEAQQSRRLVGIQPDLGKWGGFSACLPVAKQALAAGRRFCPHWLGGGVGLVASAHLLAAAGGDGMVEVDCNPTPLRDAVLPAPRIEAGRMRLQDAPGLGVVPNMELLESFRIA